MTDTETRGQKIIIEVLGVDSAKASRADARLVDDLGADSLDTIELLMSLEDEFKIAIPDDDAKHIGTVGEMVALVDVFLAKAPQRA